jgi:hypothetical protein
LSLSKHLQSVHRPNNFIICLIMNMKICEKKIHIERKFPPFLTISLWLFEWIACWKKLLQEADEEALWRDCTKLLCFNSTTTDMYQHISIKSLNFSFFLFLHLEHDCQWMRIPFSRGNFLVSVNSEKWSSINISIISTIYSLSGRILWKLWVLSDRKGFSFYCVDQCRCLYFDV